MLEPESIDDLLAVVREEKHVLPVGRQTKNRLCALREGMPLSLSKLSGITQYESSEYTFTALAGTPIKHIGQALAEKGQYLPFDPMLVDAGSTLGGTVASGLSGAGRFRFGGIRDFLLGLSFINGEGQLITVGAKVVKNAAGFDIPKLMIGSLGRMGVITEMTFKVFPGAESGRTIALRCDSHSHAMERLAKASISRWELDALDYLPAERMLYFRALGPESVVEELSAEIITTWNGQAEVLHANDEARFWQNIRELEWADDDSIVSKLPISPKRYLTLQKQLDEIDGVAVHLSAGGACAWLAFKEENLPELQSLLGEQELTAMVIRGKTAPLWLGNRTDRKIDSAIKRVFDPDGKFPSF